MKKYEFLFLPESQAINHLSSLSKEDLTDLVQELNFSQSNKNDNDSKNQIISNIIANCYRPKIKLLSFLQKDKCIDQFQKGWCTSSLAFNKKKMWWESECKRVSVNWIRKKRSVYADNFKSVVHFVQSENGTGVNVHKMGLILTCAHVVCHDSDGDEIVGRKRIGRRKLILFPSGEIELCECVEIIESENNANEDLALMKIIQEGNEKTFPYSFVEPNIKLLDTESELFCIGNPSNLDLECEKDNKELGITPRVWHVSIGKFKGYNKRKSSLGRMKHTCWTYWGHSGAPLFSKKTAKVVGIHNTWDTKTGMRHGCDLEVIHKIIKKVGKRFSGIIK